jgi:hypothetical protein
MVRERIAAVTRAFVLALAASAAFPGAAAASIGVTFAPFSKPSLRVDAHGKAEVSWSAGGRRRTVLVPPTGRYLPGGTLPGRDVSVATTAIAIPYRAALRRTPDGRLWALQAWQTGFRGPLELRFSRWRGRPTSIALELRPKGRFRILTGRATFHGRPVFGTYETNAGTRVSLAAQLDCFACPAAGSSSWYRFTGVKTRSDGSFGSGLRPAWVGTRYRATIAGPNLGTTLAPDAARVVRA